MNIWQVNAHYRLGGAETVMHQLHLGLRDYGHKSELVIASGPGLSSDRSFRLLYPRLLNRLYYSRLHSWLDKWRPLEATTDSAFRRLAGASCDVLHLHNLGSMASIISVADAARRKPFVWTFHAYWDEAAESLGKDQFARFASGIRPQFENKVNAFVPFSPECLSKIENLCHAPLWVVCPSDYQAKKLLEYKSLHNWQVRRAYNGVAVNQFKRDSATMAEFKKDTRLDPLKTTVLVVNRDFEIANKGFPMIREVMDEVKSLELQWVFVGRGAKKAASLVENHFSVLAREFVSSRSEMAKFYSSADYFLFASQKENFPCVVLEAMAAGSCVVATPTGGVVEQIAHGQTGFVAADISSKALGEVFQNALGESSAAIGANARKKVEASFSERVMLQEYLSVYSEMIMSKASDGKR